MPRKMNAVLDLHAIRMVDLFFCRFFLKFKKGKKEEEEKHKRERERENVFEKIEIKIPKRRTQAS